MRRLNLIKRYPNAPSYLGAAFFGVAFVVAVTHPVRSDLKDAVKQNEYLSCWEIDYLAKHEALCTVFEAMHGTSEGHERMAFVDRENLQIKWAEHDISPDTVVDVKDDTLFVNMGMPQNIQVAALIAAIDHVRQQKQAGQSYNGHKVQMLPVEPEVEYRSVVQSTDRSL